VKRIKVLGVPVDAIHEVRYFEPDAGKFVA